MNKNISFHFNSFEQLISIMIIIIFIWKKVAAAANPFVRIHIWTTSIYFRRILTCWVSDAIPSHHLKYNRCLKSICFCIPYQTKFRSIEISRWTKLFGGQNFRHQLEISKLKSADILSDKVFKNFFPYLTHQNNVRVRDEVPHKLNPREN